MGVERGKACGRDARAFDRVKRLLQKLDGRRPTAKQLRRIKPDLRVLVEKVERIRSLSPAYRHFGLSEEVGDLLVLSGLAKTRGVSRLKQSG